MNIKSIVLNFEDGKNIEINDKSFSQVMNVTDQEIPVVPVQPVAPMEPVAEVI